ncbi:hypothetical protein NHX12_029669 [Muraenolepis orangiensis]|uniref:Uncharacterized protein n=1 Tax=Muraenolepis orangiensis TaxID=630683 RepID=A0A9Q0EAB2_9TELE|nr:hypothetical protein NHX12_029669 [Muraenolepis orangiensis]
MPTESETTGETDRYRDKLGRQRRLLKETEEREEIKWTVLKAGEKSRELQKEQGSTRADGFSGCRAAANHHFTTPDTRTE